jgi:hypothetical protein
MRPRLPFSEELHTQFQQRERADWDIRRNPMTAELARARTLLLTLPIRLVNAAFAARLLPCPGAFIVHTSVQSSSSMATRTAGVSRSSNWPRLAAQMNPATATVASAIAIGSTMKITLKLDLLA